MNSVWLLGDGGFHWTAGVLSAARLAPLGLFVAPLGGRFVPLPVRVGAVAILACVIGPLREAPDGLDGVWWALPGELAAGVILTVSALLLVEAAKMAGRILDQVVGPPLDEAAGGPLANLFDLLFLAVFVAVGGLRLLVGALVASDEAMPLGTPFGVAGDPAALVVHVATAFGGSILLATAVALPAVGAVLLTRLAVTFVGFASRRTQRMLDALAPRALVGLLAILAGLALTGSLLIEEAVAVERWLGR